MSKAPLRRPSFALTVIATERISPNYQRIQLQGDSIAHFDAECIGGYIKLQFTPQGSTDLSTLDDSVRPVLRTYTIRDFDPQSHILTLDFVRHEVKDPCCGFAARWALECQVGDSIQIAGPGKSPGINTSGDWFFLVADMTALPALSAQLTALPADAQGYAVIEVADANDAQTLTAPEGMDIIWHVAGQGTELVDAVKALTWRAGQCAVWCACEFDAMRAFRQYFRQQQDIDRDYIYISSYWKNGVTEEGHKVIKREDNEVQAFSFA
ncbi:MAG: siderophore-interacting protein [Vibrio sp.]